MQLFPSLEAKIESVQLVLLGNLFDMNFMKPTSADHIIVIRLIIMSCWPADHINWPASVPNPCKVKGVASNNVFLHRVIQEIDKLTI